MFDKVRTELQATLKEIEDAGLYKRERVIVSDQKPDIKLDTGADVVNFCANNYLGLSNHPDIIQAAKDGMDSHGFGLSSVRFICGTQDTHKQLEAKLA
ncbi:aminotransferase class I/II-fold pyridoxal phosphate-dependent enzyme, partial [bacterium]|nr:aminotransferase class I/II-fold pyridoxal phosphate-dependent enzyme [bacterium]